jgi:hypothetical protein
MFSKTFKVWGHSALAILGAVWLSSVLMNVFGRAQDAPVGSAQTKQVRPASDKLVHEPSPDQFEQLHKLIKPQPGEWKFSEIPWVAGVGEARQKAAREGKPLFIWYMVGEPLGQC